MTKLSELRRTRGAALAVAAVLAGTVALAAGPAHATLEVTLLANPGSFTYSQTSPTSPISVNQPIGVFTTSINTGTATTFPSLDLGSSEVASSAAGSLVVTLSENGVGMPTGTNAWLSQFSGNFSGAGATLTLQTYLGSNLLDTTTSLGSFSATSSPFSFSNTVNATTSAPYAITEVLTIRTTGASSLSLDGSVSSNGGGSNPPNVPEPASFAVLATALLGFGAFMRRARQA